MEKEIIFKAIKCSERLPLYGTICVILLGGRIEQMGQLRPSSLPGFEKGDWFTLGMADGKRWEQNKPCVTHWLECQIKDKKKEVVIYSDSKFSCLPNQQHNFIYMLKEAREKELPGRWRGAPIWKCSHCKNYVESM